jgi:hypothetical protein
MSCRHALPGLLLPALVFACGDSGPATDATTSGPCATTSCYQPTTGTGSTGTEPTTTPTTGSGETTGSSGSTTLPPCITGGCGTTDDPTTGIGEPTTTSTGTTDGTTGNNGCFRCTPDLHAVETCDGEPVETCMGLEGCDLATAECINACTAAENSKQSVGCEYYATFMQHHDGPDGRCFAAFVANTWNTPARLAVTRKGKPLDVASFTRRPAGMGADLTYEPYDADAGLAPGEVAILFLAGPKGVPQPGTSPCPVESAALDGVAIGGTGLGDAFRITADVPVVAYQINPYGGGSAAVTGASLLLPTSAWDTNYIVVNALPASIGQPSANIIAHEDGTEVTLEPVVDLDGSLQIPAGPAGVPVKFTLAAGQHAQLTQQTELTGSVIQANKPIGLMGGHTGMQAPVGTAYADHAEQMIPPIRALGSEYVGVMHRPRVNEPGIWRVVGAVDGTELTWSDDVGGPAALKRGDKFEFVTADPFVVRSQDADHPFFLFNYMSGSTWKPGLTDRGDADFVISVPTDQYVARYVFFADPTYPETNLVLVRRQTEARVFADVTLDCAGVIGGWQPLGDFEWTRVDLTGGDFQPVGDCSTGRHEITSDGPFGLWVWGWGTPETTINTDNVSYGYPAGMNVQKINDVVIVPG